MTGVHTAKERVEGSLTHSVGVGSPAAGFSDPQLVLQPLPEHVPVGLERSQFQEAGRPGFPASVRVLQ